MDDHLLQHLKALDSLEVAAWLGFEKGSGTNRYVCPWCHKPHLSIDLNRHGQGARCYYGACPGPSVVVYDNVCLVQGAYDLGFLDAAELLARQFGLSEGDVPREVPKLRKRVATGHKVRPERVVALLEYLLGRLELGEQGASYLEGRGISRHLAETLKIKSIEDPKRWESIVNGLSPDEKAQCGLLYSNGNIAPAHDGPAIIIPYYTAAQQLDSFRFRLLGENPWVRYSSLVGLQPNVPFLAGEISKALESRGTLYVTEAEFDAVSIMTTGRYACSSSGSSIWRDAWVEGWHKLGKVVVVADGDASGKEFAQKVLDSLVRVHGEWARARFVAIQCPAKVKDANALLESGVLDAILDGRTAWLDVEEAPVDVTQLSEEEREDYEERLAIMLESGDVDEDAARKLAGRYARV